MNVYSQKYFYVFYYEYTCYFEFVFIYLLSLQWTTCLLWYVLEFENVLHETYIDVKQYFSLK